MDLNAAQMKKVNIAKAVFGFSDKRDAIRKMIDDFKFPTQAGEVYG